MTERAERGYELLKLYSDLIGWHKDFTQFEVTDVITDILHYVAEEEGEVEAWRQYGLTELHLTAELRGDEI